MTDTRGMTKTFEGEDILPDDYPIYGDYLYVADGKVVRSDWHGITARQFRGHLRATELRRCNIAARQAARTPTPAAEGEKK